jgi:Icc-related predicted phosphoesterase
MFVGSKALRNKIIEEQPILTLHGHIHEAPRKSGRWVEEIGKTISVNPGQGEEFHAVIFNIENKKLKNIKHTIYGEYATTLFY